MGIALEFSGAMTDQEAHGAPGGQEAKDEPGDVGGIIEFSGSTMDQQAHSSIKNRASLGVTSGEIVDQSVVQGCGLDSVSRKARVPKPRTPLLFSKYLSRQPIFGCPPSSTHGN